jgi:hypothetical protein
MQDVCQVYLDLYVASNGSYFIFLEVSLTQNQETMTLRMLTTIGLLYFIMCEDMHEHEFIEMAFG